MKVSRLAYLLCALSACRIDTTQPMAEPFDFGGPRFLDTFISLRVDTTLLSCSDQLPACGQLQTGDCLSPVVGPNDGSGITLNSGDVLEVAFRCSFIREVGPRDPNGPATPENLQSPDFKIWSTVPPGATAVVAASEDGSRYVDLRASPNNLHESNQEFDLALSDLSVVRFLRFTANSGPIVIDAVEAY